MGRVGSNSVANSALSPLKELTDRNEAVENIENKIEGYRGSGKTGGGVLSHCGLRDGSSRFESLTEWLPNGQICQIRSTN